MSMRLGTTAGIVWGKIRASSQAVRALEQKRPNAPTSSGRSGVAPLALCAQRAVLSLFLLCLLLLAGCASNKCTQEYRRGWEEGFDAAEETMEDAAHIIQMRKEMRGEAPKRLTP